MKATQLREAMLRESRTDPHTSEEILEHFTQKYPLVEYGERELFLFGQARDFMDRRHLITFHGSNSGAVPEHVFSYVIMTYCCEGTFSIVLDGEPVTLRAGEIIVRDRHVPNRVEPTGPNDVAINLILAEEFFEGRLLDGMAKLARPFATELMTLSASHNHWRHYETTEDEYVRTCVERVMCEHLEPDSTSPYLIDFFLAALLTYLLRTYEPQTVLEDEAYERASLMGAVREYISLHYQEGNLQQMARDLGYERTYLSKFVRQTSGLTFKQLVNTERMRRAALLLRGSSRPIYEIAEEVGLSNLTSFYSRFRDYAGCTPAEYREQR